MPYDEYEEYTDRPTVSVVPGSVEEQSLRQQYGDSINIVYGDNQFVGADRYETNKMYNDYLSSLGVGSRGSVDLGSLSGTQVSGGRALGDSFSRMWQGLNGQSPVAGGGGTRRNVYYAGDIDRDSFLGSLSKLGMSPNSYNLQQWSPGTVIGKNSLALGGTGVIPDSAIQGGIRLGGVDRNETASKISQYLGKAAIPTVKNPLDELMLQLKGMTQNPFQPPPIIDYKQAQAQAAKQLNPLYDNAMTKLRSSTDLDLEKRGIFNSPLGTGIMTEKTGALENERAAKIAEMANSLVQQSQNSAYQMGQLGLTARGQDADIVSKLIGTILDNKKLELETFATKMESALAGIRTTGRVTTPEQSQLLGVPIGTPSYEAEAAAADRKLKLNMLNQELRSREGIAAAERALTYKMHQEKAAIQSADDALKNLNKDITMWELTGKAPDSKALRDYGIAPGTAWKGTVQDQAAALGLTVDQQAFRTANLDKAADYYTGILMQKYPDLNQATAEAVATILYHNPTESQGMSKFTTSKEALKKEGVNVEKAEGMLRNHYFAFSGDATKGLAIDVVDKVFGSLP